MRRVLMGMLAGAVLFSGGIALAEQGNMDAALVHLEEAKGALERAEHNKGGHREKALEDVNKAIRHVQEGIQYANHH
jgi:Cu/Ag efflux pump CusA